MLLIITDFPSKEDGTFSKPQYGLLRQLFGQVGLPLRETPVHCLFPKFSKDLVSIAGSKAQAIKGYPPVGPGKYIGQEYTFVLEKLSEAIDQHKPNLILGLGPASAWALLANKSVKSIRGAPTQSLYGRKTIITYHPAAVLRDYSLRPIVISDLFKATKEMVSPTLRRPQRFVWLEPTYEDLLIFEREHIADAPRLSIDIETAQRQITCIGFSPRSDLALVVPITCRKAHDGNYWSAKEEPLVWDWIRRQCARPTAVTGQNFLYDANFLWTVYGIPVPNMTDDTMLLHHALQPEMEKSLGFLASIYTNEPPWKMMRKSDTLKRED